MKKYIFCLFLVMAHVSFSQELNPFKNREVGVVNVGIDFTKTAFIGQADFPNSSDLHSKYIPEWNRKLVAESNKFNFQAMLRLRRYKFDTYPMTKYNNANIDTEKFIKEYIPNEITKEDLTAMVKSYTDVDDEFPVAMVWIPEYFNAKEKQSLVHLVFFNTSSREIIWTKKMIGKPSGFGVKNYWLNSFSSFSRKIKMKYPKWARE